jgi:hypothetical protein
MTAIAWPTLTRSAPEEFSLTLESNTQVSTSPLSKSVQTVEMPGARWKVSFTLRNLQEEDTSLLQGVGARLRGRAGRLEIYNFARPVPRGTASGTPLVKGASQTGTSLIIDGMAVGGTLLIGDYFSVNGELKIVVANASANGAGEMTVTFEPPLRASPADNAPVTLNKPTATFMLDEDSFRTLTRAPVLSDISIAATEAWS